LTREVQSIGFYQSSRIGPTPSDGHPNVTNAPVPQVIKPTPDAIAEAAARLRAGDLVAFPTETVYGLGGDAGNATAVRRIFDAKGRPADHPVIVHLAEAGDLAHWARDVPAGAVSLARAFWPGPLTLILPKAAQVLGVVTGGQDSVGLRVPAHPVARALLAAFARLGGHGIAAPSANRFGHVSPTTATHVADDLGAAVDVILDGGPSEVGIESTIVSFAGGTPMLLRPGGIGPEAIARVLGFPLRAADGSAPRASGTLASHYAPHTRTLLVPADALHAMLAQHETREERIAVLARSVREPEGFDGAWIVAPRDPAGYAHALYANLRALEASRADVILVESIPITPEWLAIGDRLARATQGEDDDRD
jgi:L-threonylcarbamoyladenylate synthase